ncbi:MAG TPA: sulfurtransferase-like selenium metabolism protein YedF [Bacteroidales bacterium]|nr:sulfurtransferase-like selenium metabolism protein YedF [Bacteroidales bacterium]
MKIVDTKGQLCPAPLIGTRKALRESAEGDSFIVIIDNKTSLDNVKRFLRDNNTLFEVSEKEGIWEVTITKSEAELSNENVEDYCTTGIAHFEKGDFVIAVTSDKMGEGDEELGKLLMVNFIKAVKDLDKLPAKMVFYNRGVTLAVKGSETAKDLDDIEKMGVELLFCATCVNYYKLEKEIETGIQSNMFVIAEALASAGNIVRP